MKKFLDRELANNKEVEQQIASTDRAITKLRADLAEAQNGITEFEGELETVKNTLTKTATTLETKKAEIIQFKKDITSKQLRIEKLQLLKQQTQDNLKNHFQITDDLDGKAKQVDIVNFFHSQCKLDIYYKNEENRLTRAETELATAQQELFKESQELYRLRQEEQNLVSDINGARAAVKNLQAKITKYTE